MTEPVRSSSAVTPERPPGREFAGSGVAGSHVAGPNGAGSHVAGPNGAGPHTARPNAAGPHVAEPHTAGSNGDAEPDYTAISQSPEFLRLRRRLRLFVFPMSIGFFLWYMSFALLSAYAHAFMSHKLVGEINTGTVLGLMQFVTTMAIVLAYQRFARRKFDPEVQRINELAGVGEE